MQTLEIIKKPENILKLNYRSFTGVILGNALLFIIIRSYRREVVEEILDIKIFSLMNMKSRRQR